MSKQSIELKGVRVHNLKNIDLNIRLNQFVVITGVSGSGKSSLAFDTLYAEGQDVTWKVCLPMPVNFGEIEQTGM